MDSRELPVSFSVGVWEPTVETWLTKEVYPDFKDTRHIIKTGQVSDPDSWADHNFIVFEFFDAAPLYRKGKEAQPDWQVRKLNTKKLEELITINWEEILAPTTEYFSKYKEQVSDLIMPKNRPTRKKQLANWWNNGVMQTDYGIGTEDNTREAVRAGTMVSAFLQDISESLIRNRQLMS